MELSAFQQALRETYLERDQVRGIDGTFRWFVEEVGELAFAPPPGPRRPDVRDRRRPGVAGLRGEPRRRGPRGRRHALRRRMPEVRGETLRLPGPVSERHETRGGSVKTYI